MLRFECISDEQRLAELQPAWDSLWRSAQPSSFFLTYDWMRCSWDELKAENKLRVFVGWDEDRPRLVAPLMRSRRSERGVPARWLTFIEHPEAQVADVLYPAKEEGSHGLSALLQHLQQECKDWDVLALDKLPADSPTIDHLRNALASSGPHWAMQPSHEAYYISLQGTWEDYLISRSPRFRKTLRNIVNRVERVGATVRVNRYVGAALDSQVLQKLFSVSDSSWKLGDGIAMTSKKQRMRFFEDIVSNPRQQNFIQIWLLEVDSMPIASETQVIDGPTVYAIRSDYDEKYAEASPGVYLQMEILKQLFAGPYGGYNFGVGLNSYKARWTEDRLSLLKFKAYNTNLYGRLLRRIHHYDPESLQRIPGLKSLHNYLAGRMS